MRKDIWGDYKNTIHSLLTFFFLIVKETESFLVETIVNSGGKRIKRKVENEMREVFLS